MIYGGDRLFELLPVEYRRRDADEGYPLRALLRIISSQAGLIERDIEGFLDDLFIETCDAWVVPYIGDLVGNRTLSDAARLGDDATARSLFTDLRGPDLRPPVAIRTRADVAKTIYFRRRKGTLPMLEELARDVTGWPVRAVEFFELLGWNQHLEHIRPQSRWADVRSVDRMDRVDGPFDETSHTVDVRRIDHQEGWHGIPNVGFFLYRLQSFEMERVPARQAGEDWQYHFSPLGNPAPLFTRWRREGDEAGLATEFHAAAPIRGPFFYEDLKAYAAAAPPRPDMTRLYGLPEPLEGSTTDVCPECSLVVIRNGDAITPTDNPAAPPSVFQPQVVCRQLDPWPAAQPSGRIVGIDVETGRLVLGDGFPGATESVDVYYHYGFPAELGGGPYERARWLTDPSVDRHRLSVREGADPVAEPGTFPSVVDALTEWETNLSREDTVITILDNRSYALPGTVEIPDDGALVIEAANRRRPLLRTPAAGLTVDTQPPAVPGDPDREASLTLSGVVVEGHLRVEGDMGRLRLIHTTLVPGRRLTDTGAPEGQQPSVVVDAGPTEDPLNAQLRLEVAFSIVGALELPAHADGVWLLDSVVDALDDGARAVAGPGGGEGPPLHAERSTLVGGVRARTLYLSESITTGEAAITRRQAGCVRFSYTPPSSVTPRRYRCQPDLAVKAAVEEARKNNPALTDAEKTAIRTRVHSRVVPAFVTERYGLPAYLQLRHSVPRGIRTGAEDGSEMGAYCHVKQAQREANLRLRLDEYLPFGLRAGILHAT